MKKEPKPLNKQKKMAIITVTQKTIVHCMGHCIHMNRNIFLSLLVLFLISPISAHTSFEGHWKTYATTKNIILITVTTTSIFIIIKALQALHAPQASLNNSLK